VSGGLAVGGSALLAALVAVAATLAIERWGGVVGGLLATLPTTIVPYALGLHAVSPSVEAFRGGLFAAPVGMLLNALFLYAWRVVPPRLPRGPLGQRLAVMTALSLALWSAGAAAAVAGLDALRGRGLPLAWAGGAAAAAIVLLGLGACLADVAAPGGRRPVGPRTLVARGLLAGTAIGAAVLASRAGGELIAGMAAVFPAIFLTTMVALWVAQGEAVPAGAVGPMMLGSASVAAFALLAAWTFPALGVALGALAAWLGAALAVTVPATWWLRRRGRAPADGPATPPRASAP